MLAVGIDWAHKKHTVVLQKELGKIAVTLTIDDTLDGYFRLLDAIRDYGNNPQPADVLFAIERRDLRLVDFLLANGFSGFLLNPNRLPGFRARYKSSGATDDNHEAFILADLLWLDRNQLSPLSPESERIRRLRMLLADRDSFVHDSTSLINRLRTYLHEYYPATLELFSDIGSKTALAFVETYPSLAATKPVCVRARTGREVDRDTLKQFLVRQHSFTRKRLVHMLNVLTQKPIPVPKEIIETRQKTVLRVIQQLKPVQAAIAAYEREIVELTKGDPETERFGTLPGAGPIIRSSLYTLFGDDRTRFRSAAEVQSYAGTVPRTIQSGEYRAIGFRFACNRDYRAVTTLWALSCMRQADWARRYYNRKRAEGKGHYQALRCLANILLRIAFAMWQNRTTFSEDQYLAQMARHQMRNQSKSEPNQREA